MMPKRILVAHHDGPIARFLWGFFEHYGYRAFIATPSQIVSRTREIRPVVIVADPIIINLCDWGGPNLDLMYSTKWLFLSTHAQLLAQSLRVFKGAELPCTSVELPFAHSTMRRRLKTLLQRQQSVN